MKLYNHVVTNFNTASFHKVSLNRRKTARLPRNRQKHWKVSVANSIFTAGKQATEVFRQQITLVFIPVIRNALTTS